MVGATSVNMCALNHKQQSCMPNSDVGNEYHQAWPHGVPETRFSWQIHARSVDNHVQDPWTQLARARGCGGEHFTATSRWKQRDDHNALQIAIRAEHHSLFCVFYYGKPGSWTRLVCAFPFVYTSNTLACHGKQITIRASLLCLPWGRAMRNIGTR